MDGLQSGHPVNSRRLIETTLISPPQSFGTTHECSPLDPPARSIAGSRFPERDVDATATEARTVQCSAQTCFHSQSTHFRTIAVRKAPQSRPVAVQEAT